MEESTSASGPSAANPPIPGNHAEPGDEEEVYYEGSPPVRGHSGRIVAYSLLCLILLAIAVLLMWKHVGPWWVKLALIVIALIVATIPKLKASTVRYRITNYRIDYERGFLSKQIDTLELWHVEDLHFYQSLLDRMLNVGRITVISHDDTMPTLSIVGVPNPRPLYETLKQRVIAVKRQRGVLKVDPG
jgi:membrane protein YdbS with pleckstrin-like domain